MKKRLLILAALIAVSFGTYAQWVEQASGFSTASRGINYVDAVDANVVWATAYDGSGGGATINEFTRTVNGGDLWTPGQVLGGATYGLGNISAISADIAWVAVYNGTGNQDNTCGIYKTVNGGTTWTQQPGALQGSASFADNVYFWNENDGMCHGDVKDGYFEIYTTTNGGTTWTRVPQSNITGSVASGEGGWTGCIGAAGENTIAFGTNKGKLYMSHDKGFHWKAVATGIVPSGTNPGVNHIALIDDMHGIVGQTVSTGSVQLFQTSDGGDSWSPLPFTGNAFNNAVRAIPGTISTYVTTGADGTNNAAGVTYSFNGGNTWSDMGATIGTQFLGSDWIDNATGWAGGFNTDATTGGMYKFIGVLALPTPDFEASDSAINNNESVIFTNLSSPDATGYKWLFEGGTPNQSLQKDPPPITYATTGEFNVTLIVTGDFGMDTLVKQDYIVVTYVGMNELSKAKVTVYPNPANDVVTIECGIQINEIQMMNTVGQVVLNQIVNNNSITLNTSDLKHGVYSFRIKTNEGIATRKIVIE